MFAAAIAELAGQLPDAAVSEPQVLDAYMTCQLLVPLLNTRALKSRVERQRARVALLLARAQGDADALEREIEYAQLKLSNLDDERQLEVMCAFSDAVDEYYPEATEAAREPVRQCLQQMILKYYAELPKL
jgi:hypothetical protein